MSIFGKNMIAGRAVFGAALLGAMLALSGCGNSSNGIVNNNTMFSSSVFGVAASPRLTSSANVPKGGGRYQVGRPYRVAGRWYTPAEDPNYDETGSASWYGPNFHGRQTANGEIFDQFHLSAAHPTLPLPSYVRVTNLQNGRSVTVRVNDRGPFSNNRMIDLSRRTAEVLGYIDNGTANVRVTYLGRAPLEGDDTRYLVASINAPAGDINSNVRTAMVAERPSPISREAGGLVGSFLDLFSYSNQDLETENSALAAAQMMGSASDPHLVDVLLGTYADPVKANEVARMFAMLGAVDHTQDTLSGQTVSVLRLTYLKQGVSMTDVAEMIEQVGS